MTALLLVLLATAPDAGVLARPVEVSADRLEVFNKEGRAVYTGRAKAIRDTTTVTCDVLTVFYGSARDVLRIEANGKVEAVDGDRWASGAKATYDNVNGVLVMEGDPRARSGARTVRGEKVTMITGTEKVTVTRAKTQSPSEEGGPIEIDSDLMVVEDAKSTAVWTGNVRAKRNTTLIRAPTLIAHYDGQGNVTKVEGRGGVEATDGDKWAKGQKADYDHPTGVLVMTGKPEARQGPNRMKGTKITFVTGKDTLEVENATTVMQMEKK